MSIITEARALYAACVKDDKRGHIWRQGSDNHRALMDIINNCSTVEDVESALAQTDMYAIRITDDRVRELAMAWYKERFNFDGITTPNMFKMESYCWRIKEHMDLLGATVVELGGGNGQLSLVMNDFGISQHIDIDIPESLYMAYVCTRGRYPSAKCLWVTSVDDDISGYDFVFVPVGLEAVVKNADLFVNTASMGEMSNDNIRYWMDFVQNKLDVKYFYGMNRFLNTMYEGSGRENENEASVLFDNRWEVLHWEVEPLITRCHYEDTRAARYLEILLKRCDPVALPEGYLDDVKMEDWWRYRDVDGISTKRSNQLINDFTMSGTLFKLWNAIRLAPSESSRDMMLWYLTGLRSNKFIFEEECFYRAVH